MIGDQYRDDILTSLAVDPAPKPIPKAPKFSAWSALPRGVAAAVAEGAAMVGGLEIQQDDKPLSELRRQEKESRQARYGDKTRSEIMRDAANSLRPEPETASVAEQLLFDASRVITKGVGYVGAGGPAAGFVAMAGDETLTQADQLQRKGVDRETALKAGAVQGGLTALGVVLPVAGGTLAKTAGLYALGGPGGFMAQQALTREILAADFPKVAEQFDPFDPVGLTVSALVPLPFAAWGMRSAKAAKAEAFRAGPIPSEQTPLASAVADAYRPTPEHADAARVVLLSEQRAGASLADPADIPAAGRHADALARAEDQIAAGERVSVADVAPMQPAPVRATDTPEFKAWFGESKVVDDAGQPLVVYHGTQADFDSFSRELIGSNNTQTPIGSGFFFAMDSAVAGRYAKGDGGNVAPVFLSIQNPAKSLAEFTATGSQHDGFINSKIAVVRNPEQIKSAIGNSGRFDPNSSSLTDSPFDTWAAQIRAAVDQMRAAAPPEPTAPARPAAEPQMAAGTQDAAPAGAKPAPADSAAAGDTPQGLTPGEQAAAAAADSRLAAITSAHPDLLVQMDGMAQPMRMADFLASVKAEADEMAADAPLMQVAAECALLNGMG